MFSFIVTQTSILVNLLRDLGQDRGQEIHVIVWQIHVTNLSAWFAKHILTEWATKQDNWTGVQCNLKRITKTTFKNLHHFLSSDWRNRGLSHEKNRTEVSHTRIFGYIQLCLVKWSYCLCINVNVRIWRRLRSDIPPTFKTIAPGSFWSHHNRIANSAAHLVLAHLHCTQDNILQNNTSDFNFSFNNILRNSPVHNIRTAIECPRIIFALY